jgi:hypothetical protein
MIGNGVQQLPQKDVGHEGHKSTLPHSHLGGLQSQAIDLIT